MKKLVLAVMVAFLSMSAAHAAQIDKRFIDTAFNELFALKTTANLAEDATHLYFNNTRARGAVSASSPLSFDSGTGIFSCNTAGSGAAGCLSSSDWSLFNGKQNALGYTPVPDSRTINGYALTTNLNLNSTDVGLSKVTDVAQLPMSYLDLDGTMAANSNTRVPSQAAVVTYVAAATGGVSMAPYKSTITLITGDITAGYVDMAVQCKANSLTLGVGGASVVFQGVDYLVSVVSLKTRITFTGDLAVGGATPLAAGDILYTQCMQ
jgi:hypothetical protein